MEILTKDSSTPILELREPLPPKPANSGFKIGWFRSLLFTVSFVVTFGAIEFAMVSYGFSSFLYFSIALASGVLIHELGHMAAAKAVGFEFHGISVGPLAFYREYRRIVVRRSVTSVTGGAFHFSILKLGRTRQKATLVVVAGPLANLAASGAILAGMLLVRSTNSAMIVIGATWMFLGIGSFMPSTGALQSDGQMLWQLRSRNAARRLIALMGINMLQQRGVRPGNWPRSWTRMIIGADEPSRMSLQGHFHAYLRQNALKQREAAAIHLERCLQLISLAPPRTAQLLLLEASVFSAWFREDAPCSEEWRKRAGQLDGFPVLMRLRADIALECARGNIGEALTLWTEGSEVINKLPASSLKGAMLDGWLEWRVEIDERLSCASNAKSKGAE